MTTPSGGSDGRPCVGVDIGGTTTSLGLVDVTGKILAERSFSTRADAGFAHFMDQLESHIEQVIASDIQGIGIGCPGPLDLENGIIHNPHTLPSFAGCSLVEPLRATFETTVSLENDADAALLGEARWGSARAVRNVVMLTLGTGIGGAILKDGKIYRGTGGEHPELGHVIGHTDGPSCYCGSSGCLESLVSGTAISDAGRVHGFDSSQAVFAAARCEDANATKILERATAALDQGIWTILHTFLPEKIVLGGGVIEEHFDFFRPGILATIEKARLVKRVSVDLARAELGNRAGLVGAASLVMAPARSGPG